MVWNWQGHGRKKVGEGGSVGSATEAGVSTTWPSYEAGYLAARLANYGDGARAKNAAELGDKYMASDEIRDPERKQAYLDKVTEHYKDEADECLRAEFKDWLQGKHAANDEALVYTNRAGHPQRKFVFRDDGGKGTGVGSGVPGERMDEWKPTWWGQGQLTHLPGVRDFLRSDEVQGRNADLKMQLLAEFGPQNVDDAWLYFKHWVKGRKMTDAVCYNVRHDDPESSSRGPAGPQKAMEFYNRDPRMTGEDLDLEYADWAPWDEVVTGVEGPGSFPRVASQTEEEEEAYPLVPQPEAEVEEVEESEPSTRSNWGLGALLTSVAAASGDAAKAMAQEGMKLMSPENLFADQAPNPLFAEPRALTDKSAVPGGEAEDFNDFVVAWCATQKECQGAVRNGEVFIAPGQDGKDQSTRRPMVFQKVNANKSNKLGDPTERAFERVGTADPNKTKPPPTFKLKAGYSRPTKQYNVVN